MTFPLRQRVDSGRRALVKPTLNSVESLLLPQELSSLGPMLRVLEKCRRYQWHRIERRALAPRIDGPPG